MPERPGEDICDCGCNRTYDDIIDEAIRAEFQAQFEELKQRAREERGDKTYTTKEVLDMIMREREDERE